MSAGVRMYDGPRRTDWYTPDDVYDQLNSEFGFDMDPCPRLGEGLRVDGLFSDWNVPGPRRVFVNPPYNDLASWVAKCYREAQTNRFVVALLPVRTDTRWWHSWVMRAEEVRLSVDRIHFERSDGTRARAPFGSCVVVWRPGSDGPPRISSWVLPERRAM